MTLQWTSNTDTVKECADQGKKWTKKCEKSATSGQVLPVTDRGATIPPEERGTSAKSYETIGSAHTSSGQSSLTLISLQRIMKFSKVILVLTSRLMSHVGPLTNRKDAVKQIPDM